VIDAKELKYSAAAEVVKQWEQRFSVEKAPEVAKEQWRKQSLSADNGGQILCISLCTNDGFMASFKGDTDKQILEEFCFFLSEKLSLYKPNSKKILGRCNPYFVGHNIPFDLEFIWKRAVINSVNVPFKIKPHGRHGSDFYDTMQAWAGFKGRISQDRLAKLLGLEEKPSDINGSNVLDHYLAGDIDRILEYNRYDVETVKAIYDRIN